MHYQLKTKTKKKETKVHHLDILQASSNRYNISLIVMT